MYVHPRKRPGKDTASDVRTKNGMPARFRCTHIVLETRNVALMRLVISVLAQLTGAFLIPVSCDNTFIFKCLSATLRHGGPGPATFWTRSHFSTWTRSSTYALQAPGSHTRWTRSRAWSWTSSKSWVDLVQSLSGPGPKPEAGPAPGVGAMTETEQRQKLSQARN